jgi:hypothetical protein
MQEIGPRNGCGGSTDRKSLSKRENQPVSARHSGVLAVDQAMSAPQIGRAVAGLGAAMRGDLRALTYAHARA